MTRVPVQSASDPSRGSGWSDTDILNAVRETWGYDSLRAMQSRAIRASLSDRDSLAVMPTGGGKSLCYQVPPLLTGRLTVVVSPLIALMRDQVDALRIAGYPAAALNSHSSAEEARAVRQGTRDGSLRLLYVAPERLLMESTISWLGSLGDRLGSIAIDEAHCISQWGHDFRPEYRRLAELRDHFPTLALHAYTATATPRVRDDIVAELRLRDPVVLVGRFDRPNLTYRVLPRTRMVEQVASALKRHAGEAAIVYCISRRETESLAASLKARGIGAEAYHAGLSAEVRTRLSEDFRAERVNVVCATVAFGMGIDRPDVRCVIHAAMPKSVEHYQQETGRAGRDGLPAECLLLYSGSDPVKWRDLMEQSHAESGAAPDALQAQLELLRHMQSLASGGRCRHRALSEYFGQPYGAPVEDDEAARGTPAAGVDGADAGGGCSACDACLNELDEVPEGQVVAKKIISCVYRVGQNSGAGHVADVLRGRSTQRILDKGHDKLSTFGLLRDQPRETILSCLHQLVDAGALAIGGEFPVVSLTPAAREFLAGSRTARLVQARRDTALSDNADSAFASAHAGRQGRHRRAAPGAGGAAAGAPALTEQESELFESLRVLRREVADSLGVPAYVVFGDSTLHELARVRPGSMETLICVRGIGRRKAEQFGERFVAHIAGWCREHGATLDAAPGSRPRRVGDVF